MKDKLAKSKLSTTSFKLSVESRWMLEQTVAALTIRDGERWTLTDVVEEGLRRMAKSAGVKGKKE